MQKIAYGLLGLQPLEFWVLTPKEFKLMVEGYQMKDKSVWSKVAQLASWVTAPHLKKPISPEKLLNPEGSRKSKDKAKTTEQESREIIAELERELKGN